MYVCICNGITEKDIYKAVQRGISSLEKLSEVTEISNHCGCCTDFACKVLQEAMASNSCQK
ncbi:MAG: (2Fe-2S)-binding protein [Cyanobacteria bacterium]|nr:(2Fe-2S)-binding protein [Cyanobacteria bacterium CG_2015-16_32_12]NCO77262.1 (2Fe-2S)-binding protein [Cyanobacteria bacterium CG_2015-22_32_23]NCQ05425.1 (2Fe-2S)-binding protein [Cyanobacteria bacterium CG_2015-09_32_10]NCQ42705.1 (2Fe-2S)-binding protein [Cyanobacteria bacterium CG_2015-04_32_10]NCS86124.1 (2Fe-2S)-binding protein [Cyanobacteria bacterium CG_2015-02_32_10]